MLGTPVFTNKLDERRDEGQTVQGRLTLRGRGPSLCNFVVQATEVLDVTRVARAPRLHLH